MNITKVQLKMKIRQQDFSLPTRKQCTVHTRRGRPSPHHWTASLQARSSAQPSMQKHGGRLQLFSPTLTPAPAHGQHVSEHYCGAVHCGSM